MNNNKIMKPNLVDPNIEKKIIKTLNNQNEDYWQPTKNTCKEIYFKFIKKNFPFIIFMILFIMFLIYRYRTVKLNKLNKLNFISNQNNMSSQNNIYQNHIEKYSNIVLEEYNKQYEKIREPKVKKKFINKTESDNKLKLAYPMYPYSNGTLKPIDKKR